MSKGITQDCAMLWLHIAKSGGWWSVLRLTREWSPTYSLCEVEEHLVALHKGGFLAAQLHPQAGTVYGYTRQCLPVPGVSLQSHVDAGGNCYAPAQTAHRPGALDHQQHPSLLQGQRLPFRAVQA